MAMTTITATNPRAMTNMIAVMISTPSVTEYNIVKWSRFWTELSIDGTLFKLCLELKLSSGDGQVLM